MSGETVTTWLAVTPLDTIMVRDGRPFDAGAASTARSVPPAPNTLGGVVRSAVGRDVGRIVGPVVDTALGPLFPAPQDVVREEHVVRRLAVRERDGRATSDLDDRLPVTHRLDGDGDPVDDWITGAGLGNWLAADTSLVPGRVVADPVPLQPSDAAWVPEERLGLARRWTGPLAGTADPGMLYAMTQLRPREGTRFLVGCLDDDPVAVVEDVVPLGGRGRMAHVAVAEVAPFPAAPADFPGGRLVAYLATPALVDPAAWPVPDGATVCAWAVAGPQPLASASPRTGFADSRTLHWAVPAGSLIFLEFGGPDAARRWSANYHGRLLPGQVAVRIVSAGFGTCFTGRW